MLHVIYILHFNLKKTSLVHVAVGRSNVFVEIKLLSCQCLCLLEDLTTFTRIDL